MKPPTSHKSPFIRIVLSSLGTWKSNWLHLYHVPTQSSPVPHRSHLWTRGPVELQISEHEYTTWIHKPTNIWPYQGTDPIGHARENLRHVYWSQGSQKVVPPRYKFVYEPMKHTVDMAAMNHKPLQHQGGLETMKLLFPGGIIPTWPCTCPCLPDHSHSFPERFGRLQMNEFRSTAIDIAIKLDIDTIVS
jgi:hypothetical protein